jgi:hypothetical protein
MKVAYRRGLLGDNAGGVVRLTLPTRRTGWMRRGKESKGLSMTK